MIADTLFLVSFGVKPTASARGKITAGTASQFVQAFVTRNDS
jgi:hypothetical protein